MIREGIDRILQLSAPHIEEHNDLVYTDKALNLVMAPVPEHYETSTLSGLVTLLESSDFKFDEVLLKVDMLCRVSLVSRLPDRWGRIYTHATATLDKELKQFPFDAFVDHEKFVIGLLSQFVREGDLDAVVDLASKLTDEASVESTDDGFGQKAAIRAGVHLKTEKTIKSRVSLTPYRTFREVAQPASDFIFRVRPGGMCALTNALRGSSVAGLNDLPVVV